MQEVHRMPWISIFLLTTAPWVLARGDKSGFEPELIEIQQDIARADGIGGYYDTTYRPLESSFWPKIPGWMREDAAERKVERILDIGCGYGTLLALATRIYRVSGYCLDVKDYLKPAVRLKYGLEFAKRNIELDPVPWVDRRFDVILMTEILEHFNYQPVPTLRRIRQALAPGGRLFLSTPDEHDWGPQHRYYRRLKDIPPPRPGPIIDDHIWIYSEKELKEVVEAAGFAIEKLEYSTSQNGRHFNVILRAKQ